MNETIYIVVVLYNQRIKQIVSIDNFYQVTKNYPFQIIVCDNSNSEYEYWNREDAKKYSGLTYIYNSGNIGLSKSYNKAIKSINEQSYWVMLADDDTKFSLEYLTNVWEKAREKQCELITGMIYSNNHIFSPVKKYSPFRKKMKFVETPGIYENIYAVNSGLTIHSTIFDKIGMFDERLFLDMVDYHFMEQLIKHKLNRISVVRGSIHQNFSGETSGGWKSDFHRFDILKKDIKRFYKMNHKNPLEMYLILGKRLLHIILLNVRK